MLSICDLLVEEQKRYPLFGVFPKFKNHIVVFNEMTTILILRAELSASLQNFNENNVGFNPLQDEIEFLEVSQRH